MVDLNREIPTEERRQIVKILVSMLYLHEHPWFRRKIIEKTPGFEEDLDGSSFSKYLKALQLYKYLLDEDFTPLEERCEIAYFLNNTPEFYGLYDEYISNFLEESCLNKNKKEEEKETEQ